MVAPTTTKEVLYVSATRGKEANLLYVDTHYDPDPQTSHGETREPMTAKEVLVGVLRNEGAEVAAHEMIRREQHDAESMERLSAEYLTLATEAQAERWDALLARSGLVGVAVIPQPEVHVIPHRTPERILVDSDPLRPATGGEEGVELARQVLGRGSAEFSRDHHGLLAAP